MKKFLVLSLCTLSLASFAAEFEFKAPITNSKWKIEENTPLICRLTHEIPEYGNVEFSSQASKNRDLLFRMNPLMETQNTVPVTVRAVAPNYRPGIADEDLSTMKSYKYFAGELQGRDAWTLTFALEQGKNIGFFFKDWYYKDRPVQVTINSINFRKNFAEFQKCQHNLLPYSFEDVYLTVLNFDDGSSDLTPEAKLRLDRLITYLTYDKNVKDVIIDSYSDSFGTPEHNREISSQRAVVIGKYIEQSGIPASKTIENAYGEKQHVAPNLTESGRHENRRVVITVNDSELLRLLKHDLKTPQDLGNIDTGKVRDLSEGSEDDILSDVPQNNRKATDKSNLSKKNETILSKKDMNSETAKEANLPNLAKEQN